MGTLLVVDDDEDFRESLALGLAEVGHQVEEAATGVQATVAARRRRFDLALLDLGLPDAQGLQVLAALREEHPRLPVIVLTGNTDMSATVRAMRDGAFDFLVKPTSMEELSARIDRALAAVQPAEVPQARPDAAPGPEAHPFELVGKSGAMSEVFKQLGLLSASRATVMIRGESGTGKELAARILHEYSAREHPFVPVHCAAIPATLVEAELFGYRKGAFTGAEKDRSGKLEAAGQGTLFLDEVGEVPLDVQVKLLRVLQERRFERVGDLESRPFQARVVAATHRDLEAMVREGRFREDLYYRLNVATVTLPPLRARRDDIPLIARGLLPGICRDLGRTTSLELSADATERLVAHDWPGNVREVQNVLTRAALRARGDLIQAADLVLESPLLEAPAAPAPLSARIPTIAEMEADLIRTALARTGGHREKTCRMLGVTRPRLLRKIRLYRLEPDRDDEVVEETDGDDD